MKPRKKVATLLSILFLLTSCSNTEYTDITDITTKQHKPAEKTPVHLLTVWDEYDYTNSSLQFAIESFQERFSNIKILNKSIPENEYIVKLKIDFASDNQPDIFCWYPGYDINKLIKNGYLADLTDILNKNTDWYNTFAKSVWRYVTYDNGKVYGIPSEAVTVSLFANMDILHNYNIEVPTTYSELKECVVALKKQGIIPIAFNTTNDGLILYNAILSMLSGNSYEKSSFETPIENKYYTRALDYMKELYKLGAFPDELFTINDTSRNQLFINKKAAFIVQKSDFIGELYKYSKYTNTGNYEPADSTVAVTSLPWLEDSLCDKDSVIYGMNKNTFFVSKSASNNPETFNSCIQFLEFFTSPEIANLFIENTATIDVIRRKEIPVHYYSPLLNSSRNLLGSAKQILILPHTAKYYEQTPMLSKNFPYILSGSKNIKDFLSNTDK